MRHLLATARARCGPSAVAIAAAGALIVVLFTSLLFHPRDGETAAKAGSAEELAGSHPTSSATSDVESAVRYVEELSNLSDGDDSVLVDLTNIDIALAASKLIDPNLDESSIRDRISAMGDVAREAWEGTSESSGPEGRISALSGVIFDTYDFSEPPGGAPILTGRGVFDTYALPGVLEGKRGYCEGLSTVYLLVAEAAGIPGVSLVDLPIHTLIRVDVDDDRDDDDPIYYVETLEGGALRSPSYVNSMNGATKEAASSGVYLSPLTRKQFLNLHVNALAYGLAMQPDGPHPLSADQMVRLAGAIERLDPGRPESLDTAALIHHEVGGNSDAAAEIMGRVVVLAERYGAPDWVMDHYREMQARYVAAVESDESTRA